MPLLNRTDQAVRPGAVAAPRVDLPSLVAIVLAAVSAYTLFWQTTLAVAVAVAVAVVTLLAGGTLLTVVSRSSVRPRHPLGRTYQ